LIPHGRRFFHILGVDVTVYSEFRPRVLELNDGSSLGVAIPFEKNLKSGLIKEAFFHVARDGSALGGPPDSRWEQIRAVDRASEMFGPVRKAMSMPSGARSSSRRVTTGQATSRMLTAGVDQALHDERRQRAQAMRDWARAPRFKSWRGRLVASSVRLVCDVLKMTGSVSDSALLRSGRTWQRVARFGHSRHDGQCSSFGMLGVMTYTNQYCCIIGECNNTDSFIRVIS